MDAEKDAAPENEPHAKDDRDLRLLRFADLKRLKVCSSWPQLRRICETQGFPPGFHIGPHSRAWMASEVKDWVDSRRRRAVAGGASQEAQAEL